MAGFEPQIFVDHSAQCDTTTVPQTAVLGSLIDMLLIVVLETKA